MDFSWVKFWAVGLFLGLALAYRPFFWGITICLHSQMSITIIPEYLLPHPWALSIGCGLHHRGLTVWKVPTLIVY